MVVREKPALDAVALQEQMVSLIRAFGLHRADRTPCGTPVSVSEAHALMELGREEALTQSDLAARLALEKSTVSRLVGELEGRGWVERSRDPSDGRALRLRLTEAGRRAAGELTEARRARFGRLLDRIPEGERDSVRRALDVLVDAMRDAP